MNLPSRHLSRRHFIQAAASATGALALSGVPLFGQIATTADSKKPKKGKFKDVQHIVLVMMENRSFDHFLGWLPGANGRQAGLSYKDRSGVFHPTHPLAPDFQGLGHPDPDHSHAGGLTEFDGGACDGWRRAGLNDDYAIGYYKQQDLAFLGQAAPAWTACDGYFAATLAETYPNRIYQHAAQTDRLVNTTNQTALPTIWDRLAAKGISRRYYFSDVPILALWGAKYLPISRFTSEFFDDCAAGTLPAVSYVDPHFLGEAQGLSGDDHPHGDIRNGEAFLNAVYNAVVSSPNWPNTVLVINFDEWGGFFDHVPPTPAPIPPADYLAGNRDGLRGFRVPALVISPWSGRGTVAHGTYDHTSVLKMIEARWDLPPLTVRDASARNLAEVLDFRETNLSAPRFSVPTGPFGIPESAAASATGVDNDRWLELAAVAAAHGFTAPVK